MEKEEGSSGLNDENTNTINLGLINVKAESELIKLDKYYKQLLKSEKDEFDK